MITDRQFMNLGKASVKKRAEGVKTYDRSKDRRQIALRPTVRIFNLVAAWAEEWGVSWNEAALRMIEIGEDSL